MIGVRSDVVVSGVVEVGVVGVSAELVVSAAMSVTITVVRVVLIDIGGAFDCVMVIVVVVVFASVGVVGRDVVAFVRG